MPSAWNGDVVDEPAKTAQQGFVFQARHARADQRRHTDSLPMEVVRAVSMLMAVNLH
jgi:hypothetical protein